MIGATVILAGGAGTRLGGDKPLRLLAGRPLIAHVADRCRAPRWINAADPRLAAYGTLVPDLPSPGQGPLVGVWSALCYAESLGIATVLTVPVDTPFLPSDLADRLAAALGRGRGGSGDARRLAVGLCPVAGHGSPPARRPARGRRLVAARGLARGFGQGG
ncbi:molybdenum cofactor guanylyltransferase [Elstera litoralis]|uniref:molybdenum cofactor guanylyltransferase n=1 Tax=Elstera litoralis TaxID=552518 RepID=UPI0006966FF4|nr:molybdenum cofactor guanylyltransferase [Elstera litoralis]